MLEEKKPFAILRMDHGWSREQKRKVDAIIIKHDLQALRYRPTLHMLIAEGDEISFVAGYPIDQRGNRVMLVSDLIDEDAPCAFDLKTSEPAPHRRAPAEFDVHIWGSRFEDEHWSTPSVLSVALWQVGSKEFVAPLAEWTRDEVMAELGARAIGPEEQISGDLRCCSRCLKGKKGSKVFCPKIQKTIETVEWDPERNLKIFHELL